MALREVLTYPDPLLRQACQPVNDVREPQIQAIIDDLIDTAKSSGHSVGIAAPQIGELYRIILIDCQAQVKNSSGQQILINPEIISSEGSYTMREGCMSLPEYVGMVTRPRRVMVRAFNREGQILELAFKKFEAVVVQHEMDHLNGILFIDRISCLKTDLIRRSDLIQKMLQRRENST